METAVAQSPNVTDDAAPAETNTETAASHAEAAKPIVVAPEEGGEDGANNKQERTAVNGTTGLRAKTDEGQQTRQEQPAQESVQQAGIVKESDEMEVKDDRGGAEAEEDKNKNEGKNKPSDEESAEGVPLQADTPEARKEETMEVDKPTGTKVTNTIEGDNQEGQSPEVSASSKQEETSPPKEAEAEGEDQDEKQDGNHVNEGGDEHDEDEFDDAPEKKPQRRRASAKGKKRKAPARRNSRKRGRNEIEDAEEGQPDKKVEESSTPKAKRKTQRKEKKSDEDYKAGSGEEAEDDERPDLSEEFENLARNPDIDLGKRRVKAPKRFWDLDEYEPIPKTRSSKRKSVESTTAVVASPPDKSADVGKAPKPDSFVCTICGKEFTNSRGLNAHTRIHKKAGDSTSVAKERTQKATPKKETKREARRRSVPLSEEELSFLDEDDDEDAGENDDEEYQDSNAPAKGSSRSSTRLSARSKNTPPRSSGGIVGSTRSSRSSTSGSGSSSSSTQSSGSKRRKQNANSDDDEYLPPDMAERKKQQDDAERQRHQREQQLEDEVRRREESRMRQGVPPPTSSFPAMHSQPSAMAGLPPPLPTGGPASAALPPLATRSPLPTHPSMLPGFTAHPQSIPSHHQYYASSHPTQHAVSPQLSSMPHYGGSYAHYAMQQMPPSAYQSHMRPMSAASPHSSPNLMASPQFASYQPPTHSPLPPHAASMYSSFSASSLSPIASMSSHFTATPPSYTQTQQRQQQQQQQQPHHSYPPPMHPLANAGYGLAHLPPLASGYPQPQSHMMPIDPSMQRLVENEKRRWHNSPSKSEE